MPSSASSVYNPENRYDALLQNHPHQFHSILNGSVLNVKYSFAENGYWLASLKKFVWLLTFPNRSANPRIAAATPVFDAFGDIHSFSIFFVATFSLTSRRQLLFSHPRDLSGVFI